MTDTACRVQRFQCTRILKQTTFASAASDKMGKVTRRERFLAEMDAVILGRGFWRRSSPHYPKAGNGTQPMPLEQMLRIYFMQKPVQPLRRSHRGLTQTPELCGILGLIHFRALERAHTALIYVAGMRGRFVAHDT